MSSPNRLMAHALAAMAATAALGLCTGPASATVLTANQLSVFRDGSTADWLIGNHLLLADGFDNGDPLVGPAFANSNTLANYALQGAASAGVVSQAVREQGSQLLLDPNFGEVSANALGQTGTSLRLRLLTNTSASGLGMNIGQTFATALSLSLAAAPDLGQSFGLRLTDAGLSASPNDVIELYWARNAGGSNIVFRKQDFDAGTITSLGSMALVAPASAESLVLALAHNTVDSDLIAGSYAFADGSGQILGSFTTFGSTATAFRGETHTRVELRATGVSAPVPEPGTWALMAAGLGLLLLRGSRRA